MKPLRIAFIGCGKIADQHAPQIQRIPGVQIVGACDREKLMADQLAERFKIEGSFDDVNRLLREARPDVVHITTPPQGHFELASRCLQAGCHVYVEKPFSIDYAEARAMVALAEELGLKLTAGHNYQFSPEMIRMRELVRKGALGGAPVHIESIYTYDLEDPSYAKSLLGDEKHWVRALPGKLLQNVISHGIAKIVEFMDGSDFEDFTIRAFGLTSPLLKSIGESAITDELRVVISDNRNLTAFFTFTTQVSPAVQELRLFGPRGVIVADRLHRTTIFLNKSNSALKSFLNFFVPPCNLAWQFLGNMRANVSAFLRNDFHQDTDMRNLFEAFYKSIQSGGPPPISHREILSTAFIMDEIFKQLNEAMPRFDAAPKSQRSMAIVSGDRR